MNECKKNNNGSEIADKIIDSLSKFKNKKKLGPLSEMILKEDFHNRNQTEEEYRKEQEEWEKNIKNKKDKVSK